MDANAVQFFIELHANFMENWWQIKTQRLQWIFVLFTARIYTRTHIYTFDIDKENKNMARKQLFICDLLQRREIGSLHRNEIHQLTEAGTGLADKLLVHNNVIKVMRSDEYAVIWLECEIKKTNRNFRLQLCFVCDEHDKRKEKLREFSSFNFEIEKIRTD